MANKQPKFWWVVVSVMGLIIILSNQITTFLGSLGLSLVQVNLSIVIIIGVLSVFYRDIANKIAGVLGA